MKPYQNKRLLATTSTILNNTNTTSEEQCVMSCYYEKPDCLAVNVITTGDVIRREMTTGLSSNTDVVDDATSVLYVTGIQFQIFTTNIRCSKYFIFEKILRSFIFNHIP